MIKVKQASIRSPQENSYYHAVVVRDIADFKGWSPEEAHEWVKETFGIESTTTLTTKEFEDLMEDVRQHVLKYWELVIALPNEG